MIPPGPCHKHPPQQRNSATREGSPALSCDDEDGDDGEDDGDGDGEDDRDGEDDGEDGENDGDDLEDGEDDGDDGEGDGDDDGDGDEDAEMMLVMMTMMTVVPPDTYEGQLHTRHNSKCSALKISYTQSI